MDVVPVSVRFLMEFAGCRLKSVVAVREGDVTGVVTSQSARDYRMEVTLPFQKMRKAWK
jgi:hypothetical protein